MRENSKRRAAAGRMVTNMLGVVAQWELETIAERTSSALTHKRESGAVYGPVAFGYRREGKSLVADLGEQAHLLEAVWMDRQGASFRAIAVMLTERGAKPHRGKAWHASSVRAMLRSRMATEQVA